MDFYIHWSFIGPFTFIHLWVVVGVDEVDMVGQPADSKGQDHKSKHFDNFLFVLTTSGHKGLMVGTEYCRWDVAYKSFIWYTVQLVCILPKECTVKYIPTLKVILKSLISIFHCYEIYSVFLLG